MSGPFELAPIFHQSYAKLGLDIDQCPHMVADANRILKTVRGSSLAEDSTIHGTVHQIAVSAYAKTPSRAPTLYAAAMGNAFASTSRSYIMHYPFLARAGDDIRAPLPLIKWIQEERFNGVDQRNVPMLLGEIAVVGTICGRMPESGFNPAACRQMIFENAGVEAGLATILASLETSDPALELALNDWLSDGNTMLVPARN